MFAGPQSVALPVKFFARKPLVGRDSVEPPEPVTQSHTSIVASPAGEIFARAMFD